MYLTYKCKDSDKFLKCNVSGFEYRGCVDKILQSDRVISDAYVRILGTVDSITDAIDQKPDNKTVPIVFESGHYYCEYDGHTYNVFEFVLSPISDIISGMKQVVSSRRIRSVSVIKFQAAVFKFGPQHFKFYINSDFYCSIRGLSDLSKSLNWDVNPVYFEYKLHDSVGYNVFDCSRITLYPCSSSQFGKDNLSDLRFFDTDFMTLCREYGMIRVEFAE